MPRRVQPLARGNVSRSLSCASASSQRRVCVVAVTLALIIASLVSLRSWSARRSDSDPDPGSGRERPPPNGGVAANGSASSGHASGMEWRGGQRMESSRCIPGADHLWATTEPLKVYVMEPLQAVVEAYGAKDSELGSFDKACPLNQFSTESVIPKYFKTKYPHAVATPEAADIILVALFPKCLHFLFKDTPRAHQESSLREELYRWTLGNLTHSHPHALHRHHRRNLVFVFPSGAGARIVPAWEELFPDAMFLVTEGSSWRVKKNPDCIAHVIAGTNNLKPGCRDYYNAAKDTVIPGFVPRHQVSRTPWPHRHILALYCGDFEKSPQRMKLKALRMRTAGPAKVIIDRGCDMQKLSPWAKFCLIPQGYTPWTIRFYDAIFAGCIPVLFGEDFHPPFPESIPYHNITLRFSDQSDDDPPPPPTSSPSPPASSGPGLPKRHLNLQLPPTVRRDDGEPSLAFDPPSASSGPELRTRHVNVQLRSGGRSAADLGTACSITVRKTRHSPLWRSGWSDERSERWKGSPERSVEREATPEAAPAPVLAVEAVPNVPQPNPRRRRPKESSLELERDGAAVSLVGIGPRMLQRLARIGLEGSDMHQRLLQLQARFAYFGGAPRTAFDAIVQNLEDKFCSWTLQLGPHQP